MIETIVDQVARERGLTAREVMSGREAYRVAARNEAMRRMRLAGRTYEDIGTWFCVHHTTAMHGVAQAEIARAFERAGVTT